MSSQVAVNQNTIEKSHAASRSSILAQNAAALLFGAIVLFAVGFAPVEAAHNAAHDARHAMAFPCH